MRGFVDDEIDLLLVTVRAVGVEDVEDVEVVGFIILLIRFFFIFNMFCVDLNVGNGLRCLIILMILSNLLLSLLRRYMISVLSVIGVFTFVRRSDSDRSF